MTRNNSRDSFDRYAQIGELAQRVARMLKSVGTPLLAILGCEFVYLTVNRNPGAICFALIVLGTFLIFSVWRSKGIGLPLVPLIAIQNLIVYATPIANGNLVVLSYPEHYFTSAGIEILVFSGSLAFAWYLAMQMMTPSPPVSFVLPDFQQEGSENLKRLGLRLIIAGTIYQLLDRANLLEFLFALLPSGSASLLLPLLVGISSCGFFLIALFAGAGQLKPAQRTLFWSLLVTSVAISASGFLLSAATTMLAAVLVGLFWSTGRIPWRYLLVVFVALSFFSMSKFVMRGRYWQFDDEQATRVDRGLVDVPRIYFEWTATSFELLLSSEDDVTAAAKAAKGAANKQSLVDRVNNLQNLLFVIDAIEGDHLTPIGGASYALIPPLLVPRIMWPDKPRSHEGQVLLNVHFGRQDLNSTYKTYVAWGLLPEAYGNFGAIAGSIVLGVFMGFFCAWLENLSARKLLLSLEGFVSFAILLGFANSFEMVASVLVTTIFQSVIPIIFACLPFLHRSTVTRPDA